MKKLLLTCLFNLLMFCAFAQKLSGTLLDQDNTPVAFATTALLQAETSTLIKAGYSDEQGQFSFEGMPVGQYVVQITFVGFQSYTSEPIDWEADQKDYQLSPIQLAPASEELETIVVTGQKPLVEVLPEKTVFNVEGTINATGNTALELLRKSPGVVVDGNDNILLLGKTGVRIYIDGKPSPLAPADLAQYLNSVQSSEIEAIEIITNPSARYDAEGNAGIINIRFKKDKRLGTNAQINTGFAYGVFPKYNTGITLNFREKNYNLFGTYGFNNAKNQDFINLYREQAGLFFDQQSVTNNASNSHNFKAGADYFISPTQTIGILVNGNIANSDRRTFSSTPLGNIGSVPEQILIANNQNDSDRDNLSFNLNYVFQDTLGTRLSFDADYGRYESFGRSFQPNQYLDAQGESILSESIFRIITPTQIDLYSVKADYEQSMAGGTFSAGAKVAIVRTDNNFQFLNIEDQVEINDPSRSNHFVYTENVNALYASFTKKWGAWTANAGLRIEQTNSEGILTSAQQNSNSAVDRQYIDFFPNASLSWNPHYLHSFRLSYSRRIDRPNYRDLNPFEYKLDELSFSRGNPFLNPQYTNSIQLSHTYRYALVTTLSYSHTQDFFAQVSDTTEVTRSFISQRNLADRKNISLSVGAPFTITPWWSGYANINIYNTQYSATFEEGKFIDLNATAVSFYAQNNFALPWGMSLELSGWYNSPGIWGGTYESVAIWSTTAGLKKKLFQGAGSLQVSVSDLFLSSRWGGVSQFGGLFIEANGGWESRQLRMAFTYSFGNLETKAARKRKVGLENEAGRIK
ncbi:MAG: TonB-dependent receptor [Bacteroidota bacterium]